MSCPKEKKVKRKSDGTDVYQYTSATTGTSEFFEVPPGHNYICEDEEWVVFNPTLTPLPSPTPKEN
jgi:hypothetical protein